VEAQPTEVAGGRSLRAASDRYPSLGTLTDGSASLTKRTVGHPVVYPGPSVASLISALEKAIRVAPGRPAFP